MVEQELETASSQGGYCRNEVDPGVREGAGRYQSVALTIYSGVYP